MSNASATRLGQVGLALLLHALGLGGDESDLGLFLLHDGLLGLDDLGHLLVDGDLQRAAPGLGDAGRGSSRLGRRRAGLHWLALGGAGVERAVLKGSGAFWGGLGWAGV